MQKYSELGVLLNRRGEWGQNLPPRLVVDESEIRGAKRGRGQEPNGAGGCRRGTMVDANPPPPSPPPNPSVPKRVRKTGPNTVLQPLEERITIEPKAPRVLTVKEMLQKMSDRATYGGKFQKARLKTVESERPESSTQQPIRSQMTEKVPGITANCNQSLYKEGMESAEHLVKWTEKSQRSIPEEDLVSGTNSDAQLELENADAD